MTTSLPSGVILAGGAASRMPGGNKALLDFGGEPLISRVIRRLHPQVGQLLLSVETTRSSLDAFGIRQIEDPRNGRQGPLGGLLSTLRFLTSQPGWLVLVPCDAPFLPSDLAQRLLHEAVRLDSPGAVVRYDGELQPTFSLWHTDLLSSLEQAVEQDGMGGFKQFLVRQPLPSVDWPAVATDPFFNVNTPRDAEFALTLIDSPTQGM